MPKAIWQQKGTPTARAFHALAYDSTRDRVVLFGGISRNLRLDDTWEWDGTKWLNVSLDVPPTQRPPARERHALAYDAGRNVVVLFGGRGNGGPLNDTWEWDGTTWTEKTPLDTPLPRSGHALAYDPIRGRVVLFGGQDGSGQALGDTWEWDGENWIEGEGTSPPARFEHALAYDSRRNRVVLFGGRAGNSSSSYLNDTWEWFGGFWTKVVADESPSARAGHSLAYDPATQKVILVGGTQSYEVWAEVWAWDGHTWTHLSTDDSLFFHGTGQPVVADAARQRLILFGGTRSGTFLNDTWEWREGTWNDLTPIPDTLNIQAFAYDSDEKKTVLIGGRFLTTNTGIWAWDGVTWTTVARDNPFSNWGPVGAYDSDEKKFVFFGGTNQTTWTWDGTEWMNVTPEEGENPPARTGHLVAYDSQRKKVVLFGGVGSGSTRLTDTWVWDGQRWTDVTPAESPSPRRGYGYAYDGGRGRLVLFGGRTLSAGSDLLGDTWEWDGQTWTQKNPATSPAPRENLHLVYDSRRGKVVLISGVRQGSKTLHEIWEWDGENWTEILVSPRHLDYVDEKASYDPDRGRIIVTGGRDALASYTANETWELVIYGEACTSDDECGTGHCIDGVCCLEVCGPCEVCSVAAGGTEDGVCTPKPNGASCDDGNACTTGDTCQEGVCTGEAVTCHAPDACEDFVACDPVQGCVYAPKAAGTVCRTATCEDGEESSEAACDGTSPACPESETTDCGLYVCGATACLSSCESDDDCVDGAVCIASSCVIDEGGTDGGDDAGTGDEPDAGDETDAGTDAGDVDSGTGDTDAGSDTEPGDGSEPSADAEDAGCSCRTAGGASNGGHATWAGLALALAAWRRARRA